MECRKKRMKLSEEIKELEKKSDLKLKELSDIKEIFIHGRIISRDVENEDELNKINKTRKEIFGDIKESEDLDLDYYNTVKLGITSKFLEKHKYGKDIKSKKLLNKMRKLELKIDKNNNEISTEEFQAKKYMSSKSYNEKMEEDILKKKEEILKTNKTERTNLEYIVSIYESEIGLLKLEQNKRDILKKNIENLKVMRDEKDKKLSKMVELYNNTVEMCKSKCNIKNDINIKKIGVILGTNYLTKKKFDKEFVNDLIKNKKCCRKDLIDVKEVLKNKCDLIGGNNCDLTYLNDKKRMIIELNKSYDEEISIYKIPKRKLDEDNENKLVNAKIKVMTEFKNKQTEEIKLYKYVNLSQAEKSVLDFNSELKSKEDILLCEFKVEEEKRLEILRKKYKEYYNKYGCIEKSLIKNDSIYSKYMRKCKKNFKNETKKEKEELMKIVNDLEKKNNYINDILDKINKQLILYDQKTKNFVCNKSLANYGRDFLNMAEDLYKKCLC